MRRVFGIGVGLFLVVGFVVFWAACVSSPVRVEFNKLESAGAVDANGTALWLAHFAVSNLSVGFLQFQWGETSVEARTGGRWVQTEVAEILSNPRFLASHARRDLMLLLPEGTDSCRIHLGYQPELFQWRIWHRFGNSGQRFALGKFPGLSKRLWPQGNFGERPPSGKAFRSPPRWRQFVVEFPVYGGSIKERTVH